MNPTWNNLDPPFSASDCCRLVCVFWNSLKQCAHSNSPECWPVSKIRIVLMCLLKKTSTLRLDNHYTKDKSRQINNCYLVCNAIKYIKHTFISGGTVNQIRSNCSPVFSVVSCWWIIADEILKKYNCYFYVRPSLSCLFVLLCHFSGFCLYKSRLSSFV